MRMRAWFQRRHDNGVPPDAALAVVLSAPQLARVLAQERARADRNGHSFSVIVFDAGPVDAPSAASRLARTLIARLRCTDVVGWFDGHRLAAVLPDTPSGGARRVADEIRARVCAAVPDLALACYSYPPDWWEASSGASGSARDTRARRVDDDDSDKNGDGSAPSPVAPGVAPPLRFDEARRSAAREGGSAAPSVAEGFTAGETIAMPGEDPSPLFSAPLPLWKRLLDVTGAIALIVAFSPLMGLVAALVRLTSPGPAIFRQPRVGLDGRVFEFYKFRTMYVDAEQRKSSLLTLNEQTGPVFKMKSDPRVTPLGRLLRKTSIDELPQLWNVVKGDMSLVGPRPPTQDEVAEYERWHHRRLSLTPGLTCIWQVSGRNLIGFEDWVRMDIAYAERRSLLLDLQILARTIPAVLTGRGAH